MESKLYHDEYNKASPYIKELIDNYNLEIKSLRDDIEVIKFTYRNHFCIEFECKNLHLIHEVVERTPCQTCFFGRYTNENCNHTELDNVYTASFDGDNRLYKTIKKKSV